MSNEYLDFDEAVLFLKTTPSTLYKWLQSGKISGHKLGRQWRFLREELELYLSGKAPKVALQKEILHLSELLHSRSKNKKEDDMETEIHALAEKLIWDALDHGSRRIHILPHEGQYLIKFKMNDRSEKISSVSEEFFQKLDEAFNQTSSSMKENGARRAYFQRDSESIQIRYQKLETMTGPRLTLQIWQPKTDVLPFEKIVGDVSIRDRFKKWADAKNGIIVLAGAPGSGKTTTMHSFLSEMVKEDRVVFTLENSAELLIEGVGQVEFKGRSPQEFLDAYEQVMASDPDVIGMGLGSVIGLENVMMTAACEAASTGHVVLLQINEGSHESVMQFLKKHSPANVESLIVGVSVQKLVVVSEKVRKAEYLLN
jgi:excisionase family DNA binding protein